MDFGDFGFWILGILGILGILDFGFLGILDFGFLEHYVADLYVQSLDFGFWILGILDFGFWGFWILDFWILGILDFGLGILDRDLVTNFGCYIRKEDCARRTGSADWHCDERNFAVSHLSGEDC